jgi:hypothetical protein
MMLPRMANCASVLGAGGRVMVRRMVSDKSGSGSLEGAVQGFEEAEAADEGDEGQAEPAAGAAAGAEDAGCDFAEGVVGTGFLDGVEERFPLAGLGEAAVVAGDRVGAAVLLGEAALPGPASGPRTRHASGRRSAPSHRSHAPHRPPSCPGQQEPPPAAASRRSPPAPAPSSAPSPQLPSMPPDCIPADRF